MNGFGAFLMGKPEPPQWKSPWRREFERRSAEEAAERKAEREREREAGVDRPARRAQAKSGPARAAQARPGKARPARGCTECGQRLAANNRSGLCRTHSRLRLRALRPRKLKTMCGCGREIRRKGATHCCTCLDRPKQAGLARRCSECGKQLNADNRSGLCREHHKQGLEVRSKGPRRRCGWQQDGLRCAQSLYRNNRSGLCRYHVNGGLTREERRRGPKLASAIEQKQVAA